MKKHSLIIALCGTLCCVLLTAIGALAQPGSGGPSPGTPIVNPTAIPIDGGISLLLAAGGVYGLKRLRQRRA